MNFKTIQRLWIKFRYFIILGLVTKKIFLNPPKRKIIIFDCESTDSLKKLFSPSDTFVLSTRITKIIKLYISFGLLKFILANFFKRPLRLNYLIYLIIQINPKVVITFIDNSSDFHIISKFLHKKIKFIAIQNATREVQWLPKKWTKKFYIPEYYCFGSFDKRLFLKKTSVKNIKPKGSFQAACALSYIKKKKIKLKKEFDLYLISEMNLRNKKKVFNKTNLWRRNHSDIEDEDHIPNINEAISTLTKYCFRFAKENNLKIIIAGRGKKNSKIREQELSWYRNVLNKKDIYIKARNEKNFSNYQLMLKSDVVIGRHSSLTREAIGLDTKVFWCNFTGHQDGGFSFFKKMKKYVLNETSYKVFEKKLKFILNLKKNAYFKYLNSTKNEICINSKGYDEFIFKRVNDIIQNKTKKVT